MRTSFDSEEFWPVAIVGVGGCLGLVLVGEVTAVLFGAHYFHEAFSIGVLSSLGMIAGLIYGGYWIIISYLSSERYRRVAGWCFGSAAVFLTLNLLIIVAMSPESLYPIIGWVRWALSLGGGVGVLIGIFEARAIERARTAERMQTKQQATEQQNELLEEFASVVSHDLRNPLNVATTRLELAQEEVKSEHLDSIETALERMDTIIEDTLLLAREGQAVGETTPIALDSLVTECWTTVDTQNAELVTEALPTIEADRDRLRHVFENLFRNAVEHGGEDVTVQVGSLADETKLFVEDDGPGIPPDKADKVFETGYTTTTQSSGFGLGIVERIAQAHGWEIHVTTSKEGGARFEITDVTVVDRPTPQVQAH